ncbi:MAG: DUF5995 family protein [Balneolia bacterium]|nr:DUF5995 family protein [Balneolia bacterium]
MNGIDEVIKQMDRIVNQCSRENNPAGFFAVLYRLVTIEIKEQMEAGAFDSNERVELLDKIFAQRFFDAFDAWYSGNSDGVTDSWRVAFEAAEQNSYMVLQHMLLGINAHINLDLGIAAAETMEGKEMKPLRDDYNKVNHILSSLVQRVKANIGSTSFLFNPMMRLASGRDEMLINFSIAAAREGAWHFALRYKNSSNKREILINRDRAIAGIGRQLIHPRRFTRLIVRVIRLGERNSVPETMIRLAAAAKP